ncbi:MAG: MAPEG family protein [Pseudomonadota bacterium]
MTTELFWLSLTLVFAASLWIPFIIKVSGGPSGAAVDNGLADYRSMTRDAQMANRAHVNLLEQAMPFAGLVILAHILGVSSGITVTAAIAFFWIRVAHAGVMLSGGQQIPVRPMIFTLGWLCSVAIFVEILRLA